MTETHSPRGRLAALIADRDAADAELAALTERASRLATLAAAVSPAEAELAALESRETAAMSAWSASPEGAPPVPDVGEAERLRGEVEKARATSAAARRAGETLSAERGSVVDRLDDLKAGAELGAAEVVVAEVLPALLAGVEGANRSLSTYRQRLGEARERTLRIAERHPSHPGRLAVLKALEAADARISTAIAEHPLPDAGGPWLAQLDDYARRLAADAAASFSAESAPEGAEPVDDSAAFERARAAYLAKTEGTAA